MVAASTACQLPPVATIGLHYCKRATGSLLAAGFKHLSFGTYLLDLEVIRLAKLPIAIGRLASAKEANCYFGSCLLR